ncbi:hypothetical protein BAE44_0006710, partial [Dichanthelium oligosanthes]
LVTLDDLLTHECLPAISSICILLCEDLLSLPCERFGGFTYLKELNILENLTSLNSLRIVLCECIVSLPGHLWSSSLALSLQELFIADCPNLVSMGGANAIANIERVYINRCAKLEELNQPVLLRRH